jgi:hypothetical protein
MNLWTVAILVFLLNLPFGYWRSRSTRFSRQWFLAVHLPVPAIIAFRILAGLGWHLITFPILVGAFSLGQMAGSGLQRLIAEII